MKRTKRTIIRTETSELLIIRQSSKSVYANWCDQCQREVRWLSLAETANISGFGTREIFRLIEAGEIHFQEMPEGLPLICLNSPAMINRQRKTA